MENFKFDFNNDIISNNHWFNFLLIKSNQNLK